ncbi:MAG: M28 family peptidase, partial [bacterium]
MRKNLLTILSMLVLSVSFVHGQEKVKLTPELRKLYRELTSSVNEKNIHDTIAYLSSLPSRVTGYPGCDEAAKYVKRKFEEIGLQDVTMEEYTLPIPYDREASLEIPSLNIKMRIYPLWPNAVRTPSLPPEGVKGPLIYAGDGYLQSFDGKKVEGSIALMKFNCGSYWLNAPRLGVKVVLFEEPNTTMRGEAEAKFISIPIDIARFWVRKQDAELLKKLIAQNPSLEVVVKCSMPWELKRGYNVIGFLPGSDEELRNQLIIVESFFDSMSIAPSLAPGAESASGIAAMLELARIFKEKPPKRSVLFIATSGHFEAL